MMMTLYAVLAFPIEERVMAESKNEKQKGKVNHRKINRTVAHWSTKCIEISMCIKKTIKQALAVVHWQTAANAEIVRPRRHNKWN